MCLIYHLFLITHFRWLFLMAYSPDDCFLWLVVQMVILLFLNNAHFKLGILTRILIAFTRKLCRKQWKEFHFWKRLWIITMGLIGLLQKSSMENWKESQRPFQLVRLFQWRASLTVLFSRFRLDFPHNLSFQFNSYEAIWWTLDSMVRLLVSTIQIKLATFHIERVYGEKSMGPKLIDSWGLENIKHWSKAFEGQFFVIAFMNEAHAAWI